MAINFTKAIELEIVRKLKSHAKVGYQDHPNGDKQCSGCAMFVAGNPPACTHVAPPIQSHGYCDDWEPIDPNARARAALRKVSKDGPPEEARDERGRWTRGRSTADGSPKPEGLPRYRSNARNPYGMTTRRAYTPGDELSGVREHEKDKKQMKDAEAKVADLHRQLGEHSQDKSEDLYWGIHRMYQQAMADLHELRQRMFGKAYSSDEPRDEKGRWTAGDAPAHPDAMSGDEGDHLSRAMEEVPQGMHDSADIIEEARQALADASEHAREVSSEEDDHYDENGDISDIKSYNAWEKRNTEAMEDVADKTMDLHQAMVDHMNASTHVIRQLRGKINVHAKEWGTRVGKSMAVGDVHAATALGNQPNIKRKARDFLTMIGEVKSGARVIAVPAMDFDKAMGKIRADVLVKGRTVNVLFMRHGPTRFNNQTDMSKDRVRSWNNVPLTAEGIEDAKKAGEKLKNEDVGYIVSSDLGRAIQTSKIVGEAVGIKPTHDYGMRPWNLGKFTGMSTDEAHDGIMHHVENPDEVVDGGESFNVFKARAAQSMLNHIEKAGNKKMLVVSHHRNERLFAAMRSDGTVDAKKFMKTGEDPGDFTEMEFSTDELRNALRGAKEGRGEAKIGKVWSSNAELPDAVRGVLPQDAQTVWRRVANDRIKAGHDDKSAIRQAWAAVKNGWSNIEGGKWVRKSWLEPDGIHEFLAAELAKLGGESSLATPTDRVNVSLQLTSLDEQNARSPFPYDQYFFANLRNDQKERLLAALTDQDALPVKKVPLSSLCAIQDRVDPDKVQSMVEGAPEKMAVVVRTAPGRYGIADGHHRLTAALLSGVKTVDVKYLDIEDYDARVHTDDNPGSKGEPVNKSGEWGREFTVTKVDQKQMKVFGWASVTQVGDEVVIDKQGDIIPDDELEKAIHEYVLYHRQQSDMHERMGVGRLIEAHIYNQERWDLGFRAYADPGTCMIKQFGAFVAFKVDDPDVWERIERGDLPEFSIGGKATREAVNA